MRFLWSLLFSLALANAAEYVPGTPGAPWTKEEVLIVKSKIYSLFHAWGGDNALIDIYGSLNGYNWMDIPDEGKVLRLGFHDCLRYEDGTGGCDGCLNWEGVEFRHNEAEGANKYTYDNVGKTNNNGMAPTVFVLEQIYTDPNFPRGHAPSLNESLKSSGKSRADLWALAAIAAVEFSIETNNLVCDDGPNQNNPQRQCNFEVGTSNCRVELPRAIKFKTGRKDCSEFGDATYKATKHESHPNAVGNGRMTAEFFRDNFGFSGRETVAIMGAHTVGRLHYDISLFRYVWTTKGTRTFNNHYYKNIVREDKVAIEDNKCRQITDAEGNRPKTRWVTHVRGDTKNGGPVHWIHENYRCLNCAGRDRNKGCCRNNVPEGHLCRPDSVSIEDDPDVNGGCERYRFISGLDEMALPCEIGLYFDFEVTDDGVPYGCPGFESFKPEYWNTSYAAKWSRIPVVENPNPNAAWHWKKADPNCPFNTMSMPNGSTPLNEIFEEFAADQQRWIEDFVPTFEKMLSNGYQDDELFDGPDQYTNVECTRQNKHDGANYYNCMDSTEFEANEKFYLINRIHGRAVEGKEDGYGKLNTLDATNSNQQWIETNIGNQFINVGTGKPLFAGNGRAWTFGDRQLIIDPLFGRSLYSSWEDQDNLDLGCGQVPGWKAENHMFVKVTEKEMAEPIEGQQFKIRSDFDGRVIEGKSNGNGMMNTADDSNQNQLWVRQEVEHGIRFINVATKLPLMIKEVSVWIYTDQRTIEDANNPGMGIDRTWAQNDGTNIVMYKLWYGIIHWFDLVNV